MSESPSPLASVPKDAFIIWKVQFSVQFVVVTRIPNKSQKLDYSRFNKSPQKRERVGIFVDV